MNLCKGFNSEEGHIGKALTRKSLAVKENEFSVTMKVLLSI